jgi:predicted  nucleic acid-binding Zn-ribbon protein
MDRSLVQKLADAKQQLQIASDRVQAAERTVRHYRGRANSLKAQARDLEANLPALEEKLAVAKASLDEVRKIYRPLKQEWKEQRHQDWIKEHPGIRQKSDGLNIKHGSSKVNIKREGH